MYPNTIAIIKPKGKYLPIGEKHAPSLTEKNPCYFVNDKDGKEAQRKQPEENHASYGPRMLLALVTGDRKRYSENEHVWVEQ